MFNEIQFTIPKLHGLSERTIEEHKKLYAGYVKNANTVQEKIAGYRGHDDKTYELGELYRHFAFEFNGMRNHECYFKLLGKSVPSDSESAFTRAIEGQWGDIETWKNAFVALATTTRGIGWAMTSWDPHSKQLLMHWVDEQHLGQLQGTTPIIALDMWEHSYVADYFPSGKKQYVIDFLSQMDWRAAEKNFETAVHTS